MTGRYIAHLFGKGARKEYTSPRTARGKPLRRNCSPLDGLRSSAARALRVRLSPADGCKPIATSTFTTAIGPRDASC